MDFKIPKGNAASAGCGCHSVAVHMGMMRHKYDLYMTAHTSEQTSLHVRTQIRDSTHMSMPRNPHFKVHKLLHTIWVSYKIVRQRRPISVAIELHEKMSRPTRACIAALSHKVSYKIVLQECFLRVWQSKCVKKSVAGMCPTSVFDKSTKIARQKCSSLVWRKSVKQKYRAQASYNQMILSVWLKSVLQAAAVRVSKKVWLRMRLRTCVFSSLLVSHCWFRSWLLHVLIHTDLGGLRFAT